MKKLLIFLFFVMFPLHPVIAENWQSGSFLQQTTQDRNIEAKPTFDYNLSKNYRGTIDQHGNVDMRNFDGDYLRGDVGSDGSIRLRNSNGDTLRGYIDNDGYGRIRDMDGNSYRINSR